MCWTLFTEMVHAVFVLGTVHRDGVCNIYAGHCSQRWCMQAEAWTPDAERHVQNYFKEAGDIIYIYVCKLTKPFLQETPYVPASKDGVRTTKNPGQVG